MISTNATCLLLASLLLTALIYYPGTTGEFVLDDYPNIHNNRDLRVADLSIRELLEAGWSGMAGPLKRPLSMISFALNYATTGENIAAFKMTNIAIHGVNGVLLFVLFRLLVIPHPPRDRQGERTATMIAALTVAIWLVHPINLTSVLYVVQRMNSLAAMFTIAAMISYCLARRRLETGAPGAWRWMIVGVPIFLIFGLLCKENAVLTLPLIGLIEFCFFRLRTSNIRDRRALIAIFAVFLALPVAGVAIHFLANLDGFSARYIRRPFTLGERLLTETRVLWFYLSLILLPRLSEFGLYHDDYVVSTSLLEPLSTFFALSGIVVACGLAIWFAKRRPLITFVIGWYLIAHSLEASIFPLELVHEHRNYLPSVGVIFGLCYAAATAVQRGSNLPIRRIGYVAVIVLCATVTFVRASSWGDAYAHAAIEATHHPLSTRAAYELGRLLLDRFHASGNVTDYENAQHNFARAAALDPHEKRALVVLMKLEFANGRISESKWKAELERRYAKTLFHASESLDLHHLAKCHVTTSCDVPYHDIVDLYHAALSNPTVASYPQAQLMVDLAMLTAFETNNGSLGLELLERAVRLKPNEFEFRNLKVQTLVRAGRYDAADEEIDYMKTVSRWADELRPPNEVIDQLQKFSTEARALNEKD